MPPILTIFVLLSLSAVTTPVQSQAHIFAKKGSEFVVDLYSKMIEGNDNKNVMFSPFSIQTSLALAYAGSEGATSTEIAKTLRLVSNNRSVVASSFGHTMNFYENNPLLKIANKIYVKTGYELKQEFTEIAIKSFHSDVENLDFTNTIASAQTINSWVERQTNNKIRDLINAGSLDSNALVVLINAIYFKGVWEKKFNKDATRKDNFWTSETDSVQVDMMFMTEQFKYKKFEKLDASAIEMPYENSNLSMVVILPNKRTGLKYLESKLSKINLIDMTNSMRKSKVNMSLPRFKIELSTELNELLKKMGIKTMFENADFSHLLTTSEPVQISEVIHKAFIEVNEEGAKATGATGIIVRGRSVRRENYFIADHPFFFVLKSKSDILFAGRCVEF